MGVAVGFELKPDKNRFYISALTGDVEKAKKCLPIKNGKQTLSLDSIFAATSEDTRTFLYLKDKRLLGLHPRLVNAYAGVINKLLSGLLLATPHEEPASDSEPPLILRTYERSVAGWQMALDLKPPSMKPADALPVVADCVAPIAAALTNQRGSHKTHNVWHGILQTFRFDEAGISLSYGEKSSLRTADLLQGDSHNRLTGHNLTDNVSPIILLVGATALAQADRLAGLGASH